MRCWYFTMDILSFHRLNDVWGQVGLSAGYFMSLGSLLMGQGPDL